jgi:uncharacterized protein YecT (DUF1311 family)
MPKDPIQESWTGGAYNGFAGPSPGAPTPPPPRAPDRRRNLLLGGLAGAVGLGLVFGLLARPQLGDQGVERAPMKPVTAESSATPVPVEVAKPEPLPIPKPDGKLEVLPPELARAAPPPLRVPAAAPSRPAPAPPVPAPAQVAQAPSAPEASAPVVARAPDPPAWTAPRTRANPSFNCRYARSLSEEMVCGDPELAAADRRLARAYNRAVAAGVPARALRAEQDDWLQIREQAARRSPRAVASIYEQRIDELNDLAEGY